LKTIKVCAGIITKDNKILLTQRSLDDKLLSLKWEFPGGKLEENETLKECLVREIKEELCIDIIVKDLVLIHIHNYKALTVEIYFYNCTYKNGNIKLNVHNDYKWLNKEQLLEYDIAKADLLVVDKLQL
jgi:8-oxo-dGTP diphosphatase